ncbi:hypothetical protein ACRS6Y_07255 [Bacillus cytotoxicus]|uniref:hypothetical protein n=1 Tax=Bacillus cereus group TaxID=86661 RepID=UPI0006617418|nr:MULTISPECIES: hypothetical protein [Bacillus cereus group]AWC34073.1 hypothetical protein CG482_017815 [Bacillus cytotoxicus]AWC38070.1 hypothetical protein CG481_017665 [Bacillus cytotoxicus]AWC62286.1 hypothetical protein CG474_017385 [Bacillus cytotoxicus]KMT48882.1 hypothetical protein TU51_18125 [Bacillus cytotoxicus]MDH2879436.1 hypothetical protein [Bacillus cytotoxicus]
MLTLEEYIIRRKREDQINEFDKEVRMENLQKCVGYVFEYFNNYLDITKMEERTSLNNERLEKYRRQLNQYEPEVQEWLVNLYEEYDKQINRSISHLLKKEELFLLCSTDSEFRSISYECYAYLKKKCPFLRDQTEMLFLFIKNHHQIQSQSFMEHNKIFITEEINEWIEKTWTKHQVNVVAFAFDWVHRFYGNPDMWQAKHKRKSRSDYREYEYDIRQKNNLFNLDNLYKRMPKKSFIKGKKQEFEILMMYCWLHEIEGDEENYWQEYLNKTLS